MTPTILSDNHKELSMDIKNNRKKKKKQKQKAFARKKKKRQHLQNVPTEWLHVEEFK